MPVENSSRDWPLTRWAIKLRSEFILCYLQQQWLRLEQDYISPAHKDISILVPYSYNCTLAFLYR